MFSKNVTKLPEFSDVPKNQAKIFFENQRADGQLPAFFQYGTGEMKIGSYGLLLEWDKEFKECEPGHRHLSHLYGIYPGNVLHRDEKLKSAAKNSLYHRLENGGGHTGWSCGWIILLLAVFKDAKMAKKYVNRLLTNSSYPNLFGAHPPFQIDGNFAFTAGILHTLKFLKKYLIF